MGSGEATPFVAKSKKETGRSPIDYFSWAHIGSGIIIFLVLSLINTIPSYFKDQLIYIIPYWVMLILVFILAIGWEILENTLFVNLGIKFEGRRDSIDNAVVDIIFGIIGGATIWLFKGIIVNIFGVKNNDIPQYVIYFYITGIISFFIILICFFIGRAMTKD